MIRAAARTALTIEMHLLLGPPTFAALCALLPAVTLGFPHTFMLLADPVVHRDPATVAMLVALPPVLVALSAAWALGTATLRGERYPFGAAFWLAVACSCAAADIGARWINPRMPLVMLPLWAFMAHMALLQLRMALAARPPPRR